MSEASVGHFRWDEMPLEELKEGLGRRIVSGQKGMLAQVYLDRGCSVPLHSHENEQFTYVIDGALKFRVGENGSEEIIVRSGEVLHIPSGVPHSAEAIEDTLDLDVFVPPRQDWLSGEDDYLRQAEEG
ncbi:MAG: cupin domain-containing protein [Gemmatimonadota bacterium]|nr:MAG: cupin domain-containing protein [Gemmatimonadota bacterium]